MTGSPEPAGEELASDHRLRLAAAIRRLTELTVVSRLDDPLLHRAAERAEELAAELERVKAPKRRDRIFPDPARPPQTFFPTSPFTGFENPLAPPLSIEAVTGDTGEPELRGTVWCGPAYEGPPGCVHGGVIAGIFDELLGSASILNGTPGMTGTLTIRYRRPTPLETQLTVEARCLKVDGRKVTMGGGIFVDGECTAEAEGIFIQASRAQLEHMARLSGHEVPDPQSYRRRAPD